MLQTILYFLCVALQEFVLVIT